MVSRKRTRSEVDAAPEQPAEEDGLLKRLRNCWEFACLMQYIALFGHLMKIDEDFGIDDLETECLKPEPSQKLMEIGLCLLKWVSSHRGLTFDNFDEYTRRQYNAKAPHLPNPFGYDVVPNKFSEFDVFLKLRVLHQLTLWTFWNPDRIREKMPEQKEIEQTEWRIEEIGYDRKGRYYYVLDDNRLYRRTDPDVPPPKPARAKTKSRSARATRASKRRKVSGAAPIVESDEESDNVNDEVVHDPFQDMKWECIAITLADYHQFLDPIRKTKDPDEKILRDTIVEKVLPVIEGEEEALERKRAKREKELLNMQLLAGAKRSGRLAEKAERERQEREAAEAARKYEADLAAARKEEEKLKNMEDERRTRIMTREQRIKDRERKRLLHEAELQRIADEQEKLERGESRVSERHLKAELEKQMKNLEELQSDDQWVFDCSGCGVHGENLDDGSHSVACEKCNVWQHSRCLGIAQDDAEREDFHFICQDCRRREDEAKLPKIPPLKFRISSSPSSTSAAQDHKPSNIADVGPSMPPTEAIPAASIGHMGSPSKQSNVHSTQPGHFLPSSPESLPQPTTHNPSASLRPSRPPPSPLKGLNGSLSSRELPPKLPPLSQATNLPPTNRGSFNGGPSHSARPSSSHSAQSSTLPSPIQNRPSMSPTQGNHDVGPLAGFPPTAPSGSAPWTPFGQHQTPRSDGGIHTAFTSIHSGRPSLSAGTPGSRSSPPQSSHGVPFSGISPTKQSPRPMTSGSIAGAPVLPPIQKLEPSPKLMGRSSPDAPIPPPVKCMTPEQEERRQRENAVMFQNQSHALSNGQQSAMASPSLNRIPPLGPSALSRNIGPQSSATLADQKMNGN